jgi:Predicted pyridoxal phosphate-dependent enzyme apparently involved in regulation of cell wall biogenesis
MDLKSFMMQRMLLLSNRMVRAFYDMGDVSVLSFHATKVFNTFEGGAIICQNEKTKKRH